MAALAYGGGAGTLAGGMQGLGAAGLAVGGRRGMSDVAWHPDNVRVLLFILTFRSIACRLLDW